MFRTMTKANLKAAAKGLMAPAAGLAFVAMTSFAAAPAAAAGIGSTSEATIGIALTVPARVSLTGVDDARMGEWDGRSDLSNADSVCVWSGSRGYSLTATPDSAAGNDFVLTGAGGHHLPYEVVWTEDAAGSSSSLTAGQPLTGLTSAARTSHCDNGEQDMASLSISIDKNALAAAPRGDYQGNLLLTVSAE